MQAELGEGLDYFCPFQIAGIGDEKIRYAAGIDGVQALHLALVAAGGSVSAINECQVVDCVGTATNTATWVPSPE